MKQIVRQTIVDFCCEFVRNPYLCYTEHGQHALFFSRLLAAIPESQRHGFWREQKVCLVQKEYATASRLGKSRRQEWDVPVLKSPLSNKEKAGLSLRLDMAPPPRLVRMCVDTLTMPRLVEPFNSQDTCG